MQEKPEIIEEYGNFRAAVEGKKFFIWSGLSEKRC